jgi:hypothetical protein
VGLKALAFVVQIDESVRAGSLWIRRRATDLIPWPGGATEGPVLADEGAAFGLVDRFDPSLLESDSASCVVRRLLWQSNKLFESRDKVHDDTRRRSTFHQAVAWLRPMVRSSLESGARCACAKTATTCAELLPFWDCCDPSRERLRRNG